jgi:hypothetical protein
VLNDHCHRVTTQLQLINIIIIINEILKTGSDFEIEFTPNIIPIIVATRYKVKVKQSHYRP